MKRHTLPSILTVLLVFLFAGFSTAEAPAPDPVTYEADQAHSQVMFKVRHLAVSNVTGNFRDFDAEVTFDEEDLSTLQANATVQVTSIDTGNERRDNHLRSDDFFATETYPTMTFESTGVEDINGNNFKLLGNLTIKDVTKPVVLEAELLGTGPGSRGGQVAGFTATTTIDRFDYGLTWNNLTEAGGVVVGPEVTIILELEATAQ